MANRVNIVSNLPAPAARPIFDAYRTEWESKNPGQPIPNMGVVRHVADEVMVMYLGRCVEQGPRDAVFMLNHGVAVAGPDIASAVINAIFLERACQIQLLAMATGKPYRWTPDDEALAKRHSLNDPSPSYDTVWQYFKRRLK